MYYNYIGHESNYLLISNHLVDALLLVDHVAGLVHQGHQLVNPGGPVIQQVGRSLLNSEVHDTSRPVDLHRQRTRINQTREVLLRLGCRQL